MMLIGECDNCGGDLRIFNFANLDEDATVTGFQQVESGMCLDLTGGYGEFLDEVLEAGSEFKHVMLCHDCSLLIARALPGVFKSQSMCHSMSATELDKTGGKSCCEFAWNTNGDGCVYAGTADGGWIAKIDPAGNMIS